MSNGKNKISRRAQSGERNGGMPLTLWSANAFAKMKKFEQQQPEDQKNILQLLFFV